MANARMVRISVTAGFTILGNKAGIDRDPDDVIARRNYRLAVATIENEILPAQKEPVSVCPAGANALVAWNTDAAARPELSILRRNAIEPVRVRISIEHAEAFLRGLPHDARLWINELIKRVMAEMIVMVACSEFIQTVIGGNVNVWIAKIDIGGAHIRRHYRKTQ